RGQRGADHQGRLRDPDLAGAQADGGRHEGVHLGAAREHAEDTNYGLTAIVPETGEIKAFNGGSDFTTDANNSLTEQAQAGSAFKPYVLATGLTNNISLNSTFDGNSPQRFDGIEGEIQNDSNKSWGEIGRAHV